jgi:hypothetical protein
MRVGRRVDWISCQRAASPCLLFFAVDGCRAREGAVAAGVFAAVRSAGAASASDTISTTLHSTADPASIPCLFIFCLLGGHSPLAQFFGMLKQTGIRPSTTPAR